MVPSSTKRTKPRPTSHRPYFSSRTRSLTLLLSYSDACVTPGIQPQGVALAQKDWHEQRQHEQITDEDLQRCFGQSQVPKTATVLDRNPSGQHDDHENTEAQELYGDQEGCRSCAKANEQGRATADFKPRQEHRRHGHYPAG